MEFGRIETHFTMGPEFSKDWVEGTHEERGRNKVGTLQGFDSTDNMENQTVICSMTQLIVPCDYMIIHQCVRASGCRTELTAEARTAFYVLLLQKPESDALHLSSMIEEWPFLGFLFDWPISKPPAGVFLSMFSISSCSSALYLLGTSCSDHRASNFHRRKEL